VSFTEDLADIKIMIGGCEEPFKKDLLSNFEVLVLCSPYQSYSKEELKILYNYLTNGGSILVAGESEGSIWGNNLNKFLKLLGILLNGRLVEILAWHLYTCSFCSIANYSCNIYIRNR